MRHFWENAERTNMNALPHDGAENNKSAISPAANPRRSRTGRARKWRPNKLP